MRARVLNIQAYRLLGLPGSPMMRDVDTYRLVFSPTPPYELLSSQSFSLEDILFCESYARAYYWLHERMGGELLPKFAQMAGGLSALLRFVMRSGVFPDGDIHQLNRILARVMKGELADIEPSVGGSDEPSQFHDGVRIDRAGKAC